MSVQLTREGNDFTSEALSYERDVKLCDGTAILRIEVKLATSQNFQIGNQIILYENSTKKGEFYLDTIEDSADKGTKTLFCKDNSKWMQDYFIHKLYKSPAGAYAKYWIQFFLGQAQVSYNFTVAGSGAQLAETSFGLETAYEVVMRLCQMSGWYFYFDGSGVCQIGSLSEDISNTTGTFRETTNIMEIIRSDDDRPLRNKAVVWGNHDFRTGTRVYATYEKTTPWNIDSNDDRTVVFASTYIRTNAEAGYFAKRLVDEFGTIDSRKRLQVIGHYDVSVGDMVYIDSRVFTGVARIYELISNASDRGFTTTLTVDAKCPRIFAYYSTDGTVYAGTEAHGVWQKPFETNNWTAFNTGITNQNILDLMVNNGIFVTIAGDGNAYYRSIVGSTWIQLEHPTFSGGLTTDDVPAVVCTMNRFNNDIYVGYNYTSYSGYGTPSGVGNAWVARYNGNSYLAEYNLVQFSGQAQPLNEIIDLEHNGKILILTTKSKSEKVPSNATLLVDAYNDVSGEPIHLVTGPNSGSSSSRFLIDSQFLSYGPEDDASASLLFSFTPGGIINAPSYVVDGHTYVLRSNQFSIINLSTGSRTSYSFTDTGALYGAVYKENDDKYHFVMSYASSDPKHYSFIPSTVTLTDEGTILSAPYGYPVATMKDNIAMFTAVDGVNATTVYVYGYDVLTKTLSSDSAVIADGSTYHEARISNRLADKNGIHAVGVGSKEVGSSPWIFDCYYAYLTVDATGTASAESGVFATIQNTWNPGGNWADSCVACALDKGTNTSYFIGASGGIFGFFGYSDSKGESYTFMIADGTLSIVNHTDVSMVPLDVDWWDETGLSIINYIHGNGGGGGVQSLNLWTHYPKSGRYRTYSAGTRYNASETSTACIFSWPGPEVVADVSGGYYTNNVAHLDEWDNTLYTNGGDFVDLFTGTTVKTLTGSPVFGGNGNMLGPGFVLSWSSTGVWVYTFDISSHIPFDLYTVANDIGITYRVLKHDDETFESLDTLAYPHKVEISREAPTILYTQLGTPGDQMKISFTNISGSWSAYDATFTPFPLVEIRDVRHFSVDPNAALDINIDTSIYQTFIGYIAEAPASKGFYVVTDVYASGITDNEELIYDSLNGNFQHLETTNYLYPLQYMFVSTSGAPSHFYQTANDGIDWVEHSTNLPASEITIIRADDRI